MSLQLRYPNITGKTPEERQQQMERHVRSMIDQLNLFLKKTGETETSSQTGNFEEALNSKIYQTEKDFAKQMKDYWDKLHPVGSIYLSVSDTNPATLFGGTWEQIKDRFLLAAGSSYKAGATGGESAHTLTQSEIPKYKIGHIATAVPQYHSDWNNDGVTAATISAEDRRGTVKGTNGTDTTQYGWNISTNGGGKAHNNMPPYLAVYVWKRIK